MTPEQFVSIIGKTVGENGGTPAQRDQVFARLRQAIDSKSTRPDGSIDIAQRSQMRAALDVAIARFEQNAPPAYAAAAPGGATARLPADKAATRPEDPLTRVVWLVAITATFVAICDFLSPFLSGILGGNALALYVLVGGVAAIGAELGLRAGLFGDRSLVRRFSKVATYIAGASALFLSTNLLVPGPAEGGAIAKLFPAAENAQHALMRRLGVIEEQVADLAERAVRIEEGNQRIEQQTERIEQQGGEIGRQVIDIRAMISRNDLKPLAIHEIWSSRERGGYRFNYRVGVLSDVDTYTIHEAVFEARLPAGARERFAAVDKRIGPGAEMSAYDLPIAQTPEAVDVCLIYTVDALGITLRDRRGLAAQGSGGDVITYPSGAPELETVAADTRCT